MNKLGMYLHEYKAYNVSRAIECCAINSGAHVDIGDTYIEAVHGRMKCAHCGHTELNTKFEENKYVYSCKGCGISSPVTCTNPDHSWSVLKIGRKYYLECKQCNMQKLFFADQTE